MVSTKEEVYSYLEQISRNLGYTDKFHFSRRFKALTGLAPDHFRRGRREQERI